MQPYVPEQFSADEQAVLRRYVTNLDLPVFALVNLPEVVKGALFARYSRSAKSLRRLFLDEFVGELETAGDQGVDATVGLERATQLYERVFYEYGDDSVAQLGGVHLACEQASNLLTKVLERGRLMAYLEQSTRYIDYDQRLSNGHYRYFRPPEVLDSSLGARYVGDMDRMFDTYGAIYRAMLTWIASRYPAGPGESELAHRRAVRAMALDASRGLLPVASLSNVGIYGNGQGYEALLLRMAVHPLPEVRSYATMMLGELRKVIPSFLQRVDLPERGGAWSEYLRSTTAATAEAVQKLLAAAGTGLGKLEGPDGLEGPDAPGVQLLDFDPLGEDKVLAAICFPHSGVSEQALLASVQRLSAQERRQLMEVYVGERGNRRHRPGRAFERTDYRFEVVTDYGAFRDLQRHRILTFDWQPISATLGYDVPEIVQEAGQAQPFVDAMERSRKLSVALSGDFPSQAPYALALAFKVRYVMQMNAREAMHVVELRSGPQGHPTYRRVAQRMHELIDTVAGHHEIARAMRFVDSSAGELGRLDAERRSAKRTS